MRGLNRCSPGSILSMIRDRSARIFFRKSWAQARHSLIAMATVVSTFILSTTAVPTGGPTGFSAKKRMAALATSAPATGSDVAGYGMGVACGDVNNDGMVDLLLTEYGRTRLFLNRGRRFIDITDRAGISNRLWGTSAAFIDYDRDGHLDIVLANYVNYDPGRDCFNPLGRIDYCSPKTFEGTAARLYRNLGRGRSTTSCRR